MQRSEGELPCAHARCLPSAPASQVLPWGSPSRRPTVFMKIRKTLKKPETQNFWTQKFWIRSPQSLWERISAFWECRENFVKKKRKALTGGKSLVTLAALTPTTSVPWRRHEAVEVPFIADLNWSLVWRTPMNQYYAKDESSRAMSREPCRALNEACVTDLCRGWTAGALQECSVPGTPRRAGRSTAACCSSVLSSRTAAGRKQTRLSHKVTSQKQSEMQKDRKDCHWVPDIKGQETDSRAKQGQRGKYTEILKLDSRANGANLEDGEEHFIK